MDGLEPASQDCTFSVMTQNVSDGVNAFQMTDSHEDTLNWIKHCSPSVVCLQGLDNNQLQCALPKLQDLGYSNIKNSRNEDSDEAWDATFYKNDTFDLEEAKSYTLFDADLNGIKETDLDNLTSPEVQDNLQLSNQVILVRLRHRRSEKNVHIANCHIQMGDLCVDDFRSVQICAAIRCLQKFVNETKNACYIFAGDIGVPSGGHPCQIVEDIGKTCLEGIELLRQSAMKREGGKICYYVGSIPEALEVNIKLKNSNNCTLEDDINLNHRDNIWFSPDTLNVHKTLTKGDTIPHQEEAPNSRSSSLAHPCVTEFAIIR